MEEIRQILDRYKNGSICADDACRSVEELYFSDIGHTVIDTDRKRRTGFHEVIYCRGKTHEQIRDIAIAMRKNGADILGTGMKSEVFEKIRGDFPEAVYKSEASVFIVRNERSEKNGKGYIAVVSAGTSDYPVSEEAALTAEFYGNEVKRIQDAGVAGIHRLLRHLDLIRSARVVIAVAGMGGGPGKRYWGACFISSHSCPDKRWIRIKLQRAVRAAFHAQQLFIRCFCREY